MFTQYKLDSEWVRKLCKEFGIIWKQDINIDPCFGEVAESLTFLYYKNGKKQKNWALLMVEKYDFNVLSIICCC